MSGLHALKPKQREFGSPFPPNPGKGRIVFLGSFKSGNYFFSLPVLHSLPANPVEQYMIHCQGQNWSHNVMQLAW